MSKKKFQFTHASARMNLILLFEDTTCISISEPLPKERRIAAHANAEMSRTVMQLQWCTKIKSWVISSCISLFLTLPGPFLETRATGKGINRGGGYGLEVPCKYRISGREKAVDLLKRKATTFLQERSLTVNKCLEKKYNKEKNFMCPLYGGHLWRTHDYGSNIFAGLEKSVCFTESPL